MFSVWLCVDCADLNWNLAPVVDDLQESELSYSDGNEDDDVDGEASDESIHVDDCKEVQRIQLTLIKST